MSKVQERYTMGYGPASTAMMAHRNVQSHAAFLLPHLKPGMRVLDCGCGPGSLTLSLAEIVAPGEVVGTDLEEAQLNLGRKDAQARKLTNARFEIANIYELPFVDDYFDLVFISAVIGNLKEPLRGIKEAHRVLKKGGVIAVREFDHGGDIFHPADPSLKEGIELYHRLRRHNGHDPQSGRKVLGYLQETGFQECSMKATYDTFYGVVVLEQIGKLFALLIEEEFAEQFQQLGWATRETVEEIKLAWLKFPQKPGAVYAQTWCEALARK